MGKILVIAEKPSVGRELAKILECNKQGNGCLIGKDHIVSWAIGHLITLCEPVDYNPDYKRWNFIDLPILPEKLKLKPVDNTIRQFKILENLMNDNQVDSLICATDSGREGELIFRYIYLATNCSKPFKRLWISSMTTKAINDGFKNMKDGSEYDNLFDSARCRSEADWLVGINSSRAFSIKYDALLPIGRVQSPTLAIIVERQHEIDNFKSTQYWEIEVEFEDFKAIWFELSNNNSKILEIEKAKNICEKIESKTGITESVELEKKSQPAPLLYDLTELQRDANKKFGYSAQQTLTLAQDLYEKRKMITYPRTDSRYLSDDMKETVANTLKKLSVEPYRGYAEKLLAMEKLPFSNRIINNKKITDHHAIIPAETTPNLNRLSPDEKNIYNLIVKRFFAVFYPKYKYSITRITMKVEEELFMAKGKTVLDWGWKYFYKSDSNKKEEQVLPNIKKGDERQVKRSELLEKKTTPPKSFTEAALLSAMENAGRFVDDEELKEQLKDNGLGTPATRASIIERLLQVKYIERKGKSLIPTTKGIKLISVVPAALKSPDFTGKWERGLSSIAKGELEAERFMKGITDYVRKVIKLADNKPGKVVFENKNRQEIKNAIATCPKCERGSILENEKSFYCSDWRRGCKFSIWKNKFANFGITFDSKMATTLFKKKKLSDVKITLAKDNSSGTIDIELGRKGIIKINNMKMD